MTESKPEFRRQESWRYKRVKENWRRPRGVTSKMRKEESGFPAKVKNGYGSAASTRGLHPRGLVDKIVWREVELDGLDPKIHIVRIAARVGEKKRLGILAKAKDLNFHISNPGKEGGRRLVAGKAARNPVRRLGFSRSERFEDTYDGLGTRDSSHQETTRHYWVWRRVEHSVAGRT